ncbi:MAG: hypothetical protein IJV35_04355 [Neisseriaceae bacterium]|nr:hypothetical protein [Neisseriaceae bacterium]
MKIAKKANRKQRIIWNSEMRAWKQESFAKLQNSLNELFAGIDEEELQKELDELTADSEPLAENEFCSIQPNGFWYVNRETGKARIIQDGQVVGETQAEFVLIHGVKHWKCGSKVYPMENNNE